METILKSKWALSCMLLFFGLVAMSQDTKDNPLEEQLYKEYKANGIDKALQMYDKSSAKGDEYTSLSEPLNQLGYRLMNEKDLDAAEKAFKAQIEEYPNQANPYDSYADLLLEKGDKEKAMANFKKSVELAANIKDPEEKRTMLRASKSKLAMLQNKQSEMEFLAGKWAVTGKNYQDGKESNSWNGQDEVDYDKDHNMVSIKHFNQNGDLVGERILKYDALNDKYDMAYINANQLNGISVSSMKVKDMGNGKYEMIETYEDADGNKKHAKHEISKNAEDMNWIISEEKGTDNWEKVASIDFKKAG